MALLNALEALATPHGLDRYLELVNPMLTVRELRAEVVDTRRSAAGSLTLTLRPTRQWRGFTAGQFVQVSVVIDGVRHTRCYSPACSQHRADGRIELTIRRHDEGLVSRWLHANAVPGLVIGLSQPDGTFRLPDPRPERVVLVSGGSGITPVMAMLRTLCDEGHRGSVAFLHYAPSPDHVPYLDELTALAAAHPNVTVAFGFSQAPDRGTLRGRFSKQHLVEAAPWCADAETFACGPMALLAAVEGLYTEHQLSERLHTESFRPATVVTGAESGGTLTFTRSGAQAPNTGAVLLEQAEAAGLSPQYGCRMGICFSCTQIKRSGCTRNVLTGELDTDPDREIQLCISAPVGDVDIEI
jgi:ferredoxin-NADP reductase